MVINTSAPASTPASQRARGTLLVHTCTRALTGPLEWVLSEVLGESIKLQWSPQPIAPSAVRTDVEWIATPGTAAALASRLMRIPNIRFEITEFVYGGGCDQRFSFTPDLGLYRADIDVNGDITLNEQRIRTAMDRHADNPGELRRALNLMLGAQWDAELEPFRIASDGDSVRWVHRVG